MRTLWRTIFITAVLVALPAAMGSSSEPQLRDTAQHVQNRALRQGDRSHHVAVLQRTLNELGFEPGPVDGIFGPLTEGAVKRMQATAGLQVDGLAGRQTLGALQQRLTAQESDRAAVADVRTRLSFQPEIDQVAASVTTVTPAPFHLTFHGQPDPELLPQVLAALKQGGHQATFFIHGQAAARHPELVEQIALDGHAIGNLGWAPEDMLTLMTPPVMEARLEQAQKALEAATGQRPVHFRPPDGRYNGTVLRAAAKSGLEHVLWHNVSVRDGHGADPAALAERLAETVAEGRILMVHQDRPSTVQALPLMLAQLKARGLVSVGLAQN